MVLAYVYLLLPSSAVHKTFAIYILVVLILRYQMLPEVSYGANVQSSFVMSSQQLFLGARFT